MACNNLSTIYTVKNNHVFVPVVLCAVILYSFFRLKELFQAKNGLTTSLLLFFLTMPKIWVGRTTLNGEKKKDSLTDSKKVNVIRRESKRVVARIFSVVYYSYTSRI